MTFFAVCVWLLLPTWAIYIGIARFNFSSSRSTRFAVAYSTWLVVSGMLIKATAIAFDGRSIPSSFAVSVAITIACSAFIVYRKVFQNIAIAKSLTQLPRPETSSIVVSVAACLIAITIANALSGTISITGLSSEAYAYAGIAKRLLEQRAFASETIADMVGATSVPIAGWSQIGISLVSSAWREWASAVWHFLLIVSLGLLVVERMRASGVSLAMCSVLILIATMSTGLLLLFQRNSDWAPIIAWSIAALVLLGNDDELSLALFVALLAFLWNPSFGWPIALTISIVAITAKATPRYPTVRSKTLGLLSLFVFGIISVVLQGDHLFTDATRRQLGFSITPDFLGWNTLSGGQWLASALLGFAAFVIAAKQKRDDRDHSTQLIAMVFWLGCVLLTTLMNRSAFLAATDGLAQQFLTAGLPVLVILLGTRATVSLHRLSHYRGAELNAPEVETDADELERQHTQSEFGAQERNPADEPKTLEELRTSLLEGFAALDNNDLALASKIADEVIAFDARHPDAHHLLALIALRQNKPGDALRFVLRSLDVYPEHSLFHLTVSDIYGQQGRFAEQATALQEASRIEPTNVAIKTRLLLARRKALMSAAKTVGSTMAADGDSHGAYQILINRKGGRT